MSKNTIRKQGSAAGKSGKSLPTWFRLAALVLIGLIVAKAFGLQVFIEVTYDGIPFLATLTDVRIYFIPLLSILIYILSAGIWNKLFGSRNL